MATSPTARTYSPRPRRSHRKAGRQPAAGRRARRGRRPGVKASAGSLFGSAYPDFLAEFVPEAVRPVLASLPGLCRVPLVLVYVQQFVVNDVSRILAGRWGPSEYLDGTVGAEDRVLLEEHLGALPALLRQLKFAR